MGRAAAAGAAALLLAGCAFDPHWDDYASRATTMQLLTDVPCGVAIDWIPTHQTYYHLFYLIEPSGPERWAFVSYRDAYGKDVDDTVYLTYVAYVGLRDYTAIPTSSPPSWKKDARCGVLVVLPWTEAVNRPFYISMPAQELQAAIDRNETVSLANMAGAALLFCVISIGLIMPGCLPSERYRATRALLVAALVAGGVAVAWFVTIGAPVRAAEKSLAYYRFFDALPRELTLLPLSWAQAAKLLEGPPFPPVTSAGNLYAFLILLWGGCVGWLISCAGLIFDGLSHWFGPDLVGEVRRRAANEGRALTPSDIAELMARASGTLSARQLQRLREQLEELDYGE